MWRVERNAYELMVSDLGFASVRVTDEPGSLPRSRAVADLLLPEVRDSLRRRSDPDSSASNSVWGGKLWTDEDGVLFDPGTGPLRLCVGKTGALTVIDLDLPLDTAVWGCGQDPGGELDLRDAERILWNQFGTIDHASNIGIPVFFSSAGFGVFVNTVRPMRFAFGAAVERPRNPLAEQLAPTPIGLSEAGTHPRGGARISVDDAPVELIIFSGTSPAELLHAYHRLTGFPAPLPKWALGYIQCKNRYRNQEELLRLLDSFDAHEAPVDVLVLDWLWFRQFGDLAWNAEAFPEPDQMLREIHRRGARVVQAQHPFFLPDAQRRAELAADGLLNEVPEGWRDTYDFSHPRAAERWWQMISPLRDQGIDGYWTDMGEPEEHPEGAVSAAGDRESVHNAYSLLWAQALYEGQRSHDNQRVFQLHRSGYAGIQRYGVAVWSGDIASSWKVLQEQIRAGLGASMSGLPFWCTDIGGFFSGISGFDGYHLPQEFSPELYVRWFQYGVFCPIFRAHGTRPTNEPWSFGPESWRVLKQFLDLRYRLAPYIYSCAWQTVFTGLPMMRPLLIDFPDDPAARSCSDQFMFGPALLVAPVSDIGVRARSIYLPDGQWYDFWTGALVHGGRRVDVAAPLDRIPLFVRAGSVVPTIAGPAPRRMLGRWHSVELLLYPGSAAPFVYRDDEGLQYDEPVTELTLDYDGATDVAIAGAEGTIQHVRAGAAALSVADVAWSATRVVTVPEIEVSVDVTFAEDGRTRITCMAHAGALPVAAQPALELSIPDGWVLVEKSSLQTDKLDYGTQWLLLPVGIALPLRYRSQITGTLAGLAVDRTVWWGSGWATRFSMLGPFENPENQALSRREIDPRAVPEYADTSNGRLFWQYHPEHAFPCHGYINLRRVGTDHIAATAQDTQLKHAAVYGRAIIYAEREQTAVADYAGEDGLAIWINGELVAEHFSPVLSETSEPVTLHAGRNEVLIKATMHSTHPGSGRELGAFFRMVDPNDGTLLDLLYAPW